MTSLGFENYAEALKIYLSKYREVSSLARFLLPDHLRTHHYSIPQHRILLHASLDGVRG